MSVRSKLRLRAQRRKLQWRGVRSRHALSPRSGQDRPVPKSGTLLFSTVRNERARLPWFLDYYRALGVVAFFIVDNDSTDDTGAYLARQPDVQLWHTDASYRDSNFGTDWLNWLKLRYAHDRWTLTVDPDEFLVYPFCDSRPLDALTDWLDDAGTRSFGTLLVDTYPKGAVGDAVYGPGDDPFEQACWFDSGNYTYKRNPKMGNLWIQGGARARVYFAQTPEQAPSLNKVPLVRWDRRFAYASSTHMLLPRGLNKVYDETGGEMTSGCLLHPKFLNVLVDKAAEELARRQHFAQGREYEAYNRAADTGLWTPWSEQFQGWQQLERLGLMSSGGWA